MDASKVNVAIRRLLILIEIVLCMLLIVSCSAGQPDSKATATAQSLAKGTALYGQYCMSCHGGSTGGSLTDIPPPHNANGHTWHHPDQQLKDIILNGLDLSTDSQKMPAFKDKLSNSDVLNILEYIKTWWTPEQRQFQAAATKQITDYENGK